MNDALLQKPQSGDCALASRLFSAGDFRRAASMSRALLARDDLSPGQQAELRYILTATALDPAVYAVFCLSLAVLVLNFALFVF